MEENKNFESDYEPQQSGGNSPYPPYNPYIVPPKILEERRAVRKAALAVGLPILAIYLVTAYWFTALTFITSFFGVSAEKLVSLVSEPAVLQLLQIVISILSFLIPFVAAVKLTGNRVDTLVPFNAPKKEHALDYLLFGVGFCAFANMATSFAGSFFEGIGISDNSPDPELPTGIFGFLLTFLSTAVVPAIVEEFACRGVIIGFLRRFGDLFAVVTSAIIFGIMHGNFGQIPFAILVGLVLGFIRIKSGSIWLAVAVHFVNNLVAVVCSYIPNINTAAGNAGYTVYLALALIAGVVGLIRLSENGRIELSDDCEIAQGSRHKWFWLHPAIIIFALLNLIGAVAYLF